MGEEEDRLLVFEAIVMGLIAACLCRGRGSRRSGVEQAEVMAEVEAEVEVGVELSVETGSEVGAEVAVAVEVVYWCSCACKSKGDIL
jgi:hypothetical protein